MKDTHQARTQDFLKGGSKIEMKRKVTKMYYVCSRESIMTARDLGPPKGPRS